MFSLHSTKEPTGAPWFWTSAQPNSTLIKHLQLFRALCFFLPWGVKCPPLVQRMCPLVAPGTSNFYVCNKCILFFQIIWTEYCLLSLLLVVIKIWQKRSPLPPVRSVVLYVSKVYAPALSDVKELNLPQNGWILFIH